MPDLLMTEPRQAALRALLAADPVPGEPLPAGPVFDAIAQLVPCDLYGATLTDMQGRRLQEVHRVQGPHHRTKVVPPPFGDADPDGEGGPYHIGWIHWTRNPRMAEQCNGTEGVDDLAIGFRNGTDLVVQLGFVRETRTFTDEELALLRMLVPAFGRLMRERPTPRLPVELTVSERRVLHGVAAGQSNADIAECFCVAESTVRKHLENAYRKLGVSNRMAAVARMSGRDHDSTDLRERLETFAGTRMVTEASSF